MEKSNDRFFRIETFIYGYLLEMSLISRASDSRRRLIAADIARKIIYVLLTPWRVSVHFSRRLRFFYYTKCWVHYILGKVHINSLSHFTTIGKMQRFIIMSLSNSMKIRNCGSVTILPCRMAPLFPVSIRSGLEIM